MVARGDLALALGERIEAISDGGISNAKNNGWASSSNPNNIKFDMQGGKKAHKTYKLGVSLIYAWSSITKDYIYDI